LQSRRPAGRVAELGSLGGFTRTVQSNTPSQADAPAQDERPPLVRAIFEGNAGAAARAIADGADPNGIYAEASMVWLATFHGQPEVLAALIRGGARIQPDALKTLGEMEITDHMIDPIELEEHYARVAQILLDHGATVEVSAYDGRPLIETFPARYYPRIHRVLSRGGSQ
jgi:hypothetical protein